MIFFVVGWETYELNQRKIEEWETGRPGGHYDYQDVS